jgi:hypothetical protein
MSVLGAQVTLLHYSNVIIGAHGILEAGECQMLEAASKTCQFTLKRLSNSGDQCYNFTYLFAKHVHMDDILHGYLLSLFL